MAGRYLKISEPGQLGDDVFGNAVSQILLVVVAAEIIERQDRNRGPGVLRSRQAPPQRVACRARCDRF